MMVKIVMVIIDIKERNYMTDMEIAITQTITQTRKIDTDKFNEKNYCHPNNL
jgi:hypothetical protein